jgi:hypothetical protein
MSVLSFPRLYFHGFMEWDVNTANNNDYLPTYDGADAALDWSFLARQNPPITQENFRDTFRPWVIRPAGDSCPPSDPGSPTPDNCSDSATCHMASRWNYYGGNGCSFVQYEKGGKVTRTTGGDLGYGRPAAASDPILGQPIAMAGNTFGGRKSPARLVDINPASPFCSQIYLAGFQAGNGGTSIGGPPVERMTSRSFFVPRNISSDLIIAGAIGVLFQTTIPKSAIQFGNAGNSPLLAALYEAVQAAGAAGLMLRFSAYDTLYYQNGIFNDQPYQPRTCDELTVLYQEGKVFLNPAYSSVTGVIGVWNEGELATAPGGHLLVPNALVQPIAASAASAPGAAARAARPVRAAAPIAMAGHAHVGHLDVAPGDPAVAAAASGGPALALGMIVAEVNAGAGIVSLDFENAIPEWDLAGVRFNYGTIEVGVQNGGAFQTIGSFGYDQYDHTAYEARGGIVDVPFGPGVTAAQVSEWMASPEALLALRIGGTVASLEAPLTVDTDERAVYVDQCRTEQIQLQVRYRNAPPPAGTRVLLAQYYPWPLVLGSGQWQLFGAPPPATGGGVCTEAATTPYLTFPGLPPVPVVAVDGAGNATVPIAAQDSGFPLLAYYPYLPGQSQPVPQSQVTFGFAGYSTYSVSTAYYSAIRVLPFDNALVGRFVDRWNGTGSYAGQPKYDRLLTWQFIYGNILYVYDMLYPVMDAFMPLGNLVRVEGAIDQLMLMVAESMESSTLYMPVTRELSAGKRLILESWGELVSRKYPQEDLPPLAVRCD